MKILRENRVGGYLLRSRGSKIDDYKRGLSASMQADSDGAITWLLPGSGNVYQKQGNASKAEDYKQQAAKLTN